MRLCDKQPSVTDNAKAKVVIEKITQAHRYRAFRCGDNALDMYLIRFALVNDENGTGRTYVMVEESRNKVLGYYTLAMSHVVFEYLPEVDRRRLPQYPIPTARIAKLARDLSLRGQDFGEFLLMDALKKIVDIADAIGVHLVEVDAKSEKAKSFYLRYGFGSFLDDPLHLYIPMSRIRALPLR